MSTGYIDFVVRRRRVLCLSWVWHIDTEEGAQTPICLNAGLLVVRRSRIGKSSLKPNAPITPELLLGSLSSVGLFHPASRYIGQLLLVIHPNALLDLVQPRRY